MKKDLHPDNYRPVIFRDQSAGFTFLTRSTAKSDQKLKWEDGNEYPVVDVYISSASHPFYTGKEKLVDVEGRVDKFKARQKAAAERSGKMTAKAEKQMKKIAEQAKLDDEKQKAQEAVIKKSRPAAKTEA
jgi:large subunit ribosomal protein L31